MKSVNIFHIRNSASQAIEIRMVEPLSVVGKHCGYKLNTEFTQVMQLHVYKEHVWPSVSSLCFFLFFPLGVQYNLLLLLCIQV